MPVPASLLHPPATAVALLQTVALALAPHGGQHAARRNAWAGMAADAQRSRARREATAAVEQAQQAAVRRAPAVAVARHG